MHALRTLIGIAACLIFAGAAFAEPASVVSTVNLRTAAGTSNEVVVKIPTGSLVDASNCSEWCEVEWQGKKGFAIATALDRSGRVPPPRRAAAARPGPGPGRGYTEDEYVPVDPPVAYGPPPAYYYGYRPYYRPWGWRRHSW
jgi:hypothetical protein